jgi:hypothetical protein
MKKIIALVFLAVLSFSALAATKCVPNGQGGMCCWDTASEGPFRPIGC